MSCPSNFRFTRPGGSGASINPNIAAPRANRASTPALCSGVKFAGENRLKGEGSVIFGDADLGDTRITPDDSWVMFGVTVLVSVLTFSH